MIVPSFVLPTRSEESVFLFPNPCSLLLDFLPPITVVVQEIIFVPGVEQGPEKHADDFETSHAAEAPVGGVDAPTQHAKTPVRDFLAQQVILRIQRPFMESAQFLK